MYYLSNIISIPLCNSRAAHEILKCAMYLFLGYLDGAAQLAQSCGGGGTSSDLPRGRTPDEDDSGFAYRCMMQSHKMFRPAAPKRGMGGRRHEGVLKFAIKIRLIVIS